MIHSQPNCGQNNCRNFIYCNDVGGLNQPFAMPLAALKVDVSGEDGEAIIFPSMPAQNCPAELSNKLARVALSCLNTHPSDIFSPGQFNSPTETRNIVICSAKHPCLVLHYLSVFFCLYLLTSGCKGSQSVDGLTILAFHVS